MIHPETGNDRTDDILLHMAMYGVSTRDVLHKLFFEPSVSLNAVTQVTSRLVDQEYLSRFQPSREFTYFRLGSKGVSCMQLPPSRMYPLGEQQLSRYFAMLYFAAYSGACRQKIDWQEFDRCPGFPSHLVNLDWYLDDDEKGLERIGRLYYSFNGNPGEVVETIAHDVHLFKALPILGELIEKQGLVATVVTHCEKRSALLLRDFELDPPGIPIGLFSHPRLRQFSA